MSHHVIFMIHHVTICYLHVTSCYHHVTKLLHPVAMRSRARTSCCSFCGRNCCRKVSSSRLQCSMGRYEGFCCSGDYDRRRIWGTNCLHVWPVAVLRQRRWCHFQRPHSIIRLIVTPLMMTQVLFFKVVALFSAAFNFTHFAWPFEILLHAVLSTICSWGENSLHLKLSRDASVGPYIASQ